MGQEDPLSPYFFLLRGSQLNYRLGQLECEYLPVDKVPKFVKEEGAQMSYTKLLFPGTVFPQKQENGLGR